MHDQQVHGCRLYQAWKLIVLSIDLQPFNNFNNENGRRLTDARFVFGCKSLAIAS